jgi:histidinol-phosphatase (PHP family)
MTSPPYRADYHMHTRWCGHAVGEMRDYVEAAIAQGLTEIGFSVHMPITIPYEGKLYLAAEEMPLYVDSWKRLRDEYAGRIRLLLAGECDFAPGQEAEIEAAIQAYPFDYIIGAIHFIDGWSFDNPDRTETWADADVAAVYRRYYALLAQAARSGYYDIVSHFDLVKKFGHRPDQDLTDAEAAACDAVAQAGMTVEINTSGWDKPAAEQYPSEKLLQMLFERGVALCFGSDAHAPEQVGRHFARARKLARRIGWTTVARYRQRRRQAEPLAP